jgi:hypothetical protein
MSERYPRFLDPSEPFRPLTVPYESLRDRRDEVEEGRPQTLMQVVVGKRGSRRTDEQRIPLLAQRGSAPFARGWNRTVFSQVSRLVTG